MKLFGHCLSLFAIAGMLGAARAGSCGTVTYSGGYVGATYHAPTYYEKPHVEKIIVLDYLPPYPVGYAAPYAPPPAPVATPTPCEETSKKLQARLDALEAKLGTPAPAKEPATAPASAPPPAPNGGGKSPTVLVGKCAACHDTANAAGRGKGVVLFDGGSPTKWDAETAGKVLREVSSGRMPKGAKLDPEDFAAAAQEIFDLSSR